MSKHKVKHALSVKDMRPGDVYVSMDEYYPIVFWADGERDVQHINPRDGSSWRLIADPDVNQLFPAKRIYKQQR